MVTDADQEPVATHGKRLPEMMRFVAVGVVATGIQYAVYCLLLPFASASVAFTLGTLVSILCNYFMSSRITFRVAPSLRRFASFVMSHVVNYFIQIILLNLFIGLGVGERLAPLPVYALAVPINYLNVRYALTRRGRDGDSYWLFLLSAGFAMLWLQLLDVPTLGDDMLYRFMWHADEGAPVESIAGLGDLLRSQCAHYASTNGRFVFHLLAQASLVFLPAVVMQVAHTLMFVLLIHLSVLWVAPGARHRLAAAVVLCTLLFVVFCGFRTAILWGLGAFNYLWPLVAVLALLLSLRRCCGGVSPAGAWARCRWAVLPLAFLAGWSHEALSVPVSMAFVAWMVAQAWASRRRASPVARCRRLVAASMLLFVMGTALILLSPALWHRAGEASGLQGRLVSGVVNCVFNVRVAWLLAVVALAAWWRQRGVWRAHVSAHRYEYVALGSALGIVLACGVTLERVAFFTDFIAMLLLLELLAAWLRTKPRRAAAAGAAERWAVAAGCLLMLLAYVPAYMLRSENAGVWQQAAEQMREPGRELIAVETPWKGQSTVADLLREHYVNSSLHFGFYESYMAFDCKDVNMRCAAKMFGKERLAFLPDDVVRRIETDSTAYAGYELDRNADLYVWRVKDSPTVRAVTFVLGQEDTSKLLPHQRLLAYQGDEYELDDFHFEVVSVCSRPYLVLTKPTTNIFRRIKDIEIQSD